ncbi:hypothetical protein [Calothrix sp. UHCC 0171]|uniref:hypothetical protein n=1 Tax=Calothrix sp. UHCC 0171 TaxID=3110245 RepID=UPI002B2165C0|nr:hypothetical protein [Calothrix sp. UHCC 0171]MEA5571051.1 hypothetical protein [Calothrix sp. UHCC 0171]
MLVFFIHGVNTTNSNYANVLTQKIKQELHNNDYVNSANFYSSFWGNLFNNKKEQTVSYIEEDFKLACTKHQEYEWLHDDIYRYRERRSQFINNFLGDFLIYQNPERGKEIRRSILEDFNRFKKDHSTETEIHFIAHSLGSIILWDILFANTFSKDDPAFLFREQLKHLDLASITTLGSPLLFLKQMWDIDFSLINLLLNEVNRKNILRWINVIHSSDLAAYPLNAAIKDEIGSKIFFCDQYVWQDANGTEKALNTIGKSDLAMVVGAEDAHSSYFYDNLDGAITSRLIAYNLLGKTENLKKRCITPRL